MSDRIKDFSFLCKYSDLKENTGTRFFVDQADIAVFKVNGEIFALGNVCPHQHSPIIFDGMIEDGNVVCPAHGWSFQLSSGKLDGKSRGLEKYEIKILEEDIYIKISGKKNDLF